MKDMYKYYIVKNMDTNMWIVEDSTVQDIDLLFSTQACKYLA